MAEDGRKRGPAAQSLRGLSAAPHEEESQRALEHPPQAAHEPAPELGIRPMLKTAASASTVSAEDKYRAAKCYPYMPRRLAL
jgi:hypothetical protein